MPRPLLTEGISFGGFAALRLPFRVQASLKESNYIVADNDAAGPEPASLALEPSGFRYRPFSEARASAEPVGILSPPLQT
jgi:hypothetical protein